MNMVTLQTIGTMIVFAGLGTALARKAKIPNIVVYLLVGVVLSLLETTFLGARELESARRSVDLISHAGISLLLFLVGMELSFSKIKAIGKVAVYAGLGQIVFTLLFGALLALGVGFELVPSLVIGTALTFSSTVLVVKLLGDKRDLNSLYGRISVGIFLVQDIVVIVILTVLTGLSVGEPLAGGKFKAEVSLFLGVGKAFLGTVALMSFSFIATKFALKRLFKWAGSSEVLFVSSLAWCFAVVGLADVFKLSSEIGAFVAGVSLAQLSLGGTLQQRIKPLTNFFVAVFFISLGMSLNPASALSHLGSSLLFSAFVLVGNPLIFMWIILKFGHDKRTSFKAGLAVAQISEFSFIFAAMAAQKGFVGEETLSIVSLVGLVTIVGSAYMIIYNERIYRYFERKGFLRFFRSSERKVLESSRDCAGRRNHVVVIGMNSLGREISWRLAALGQEVLAVDKNPDTLADMPVEALVRNAEYESIAEEAEFESAKLVVIALRLEDVNNTVIFHCQKRGVPVAAHGFDKTVIDGLKRLRADYVIDSKSSWVKKLVWELEKLEETLP